MIIGIFAGIPFINIVGPVLVALAVTGFKILAEEGGIHRTGLPKVDFYDNCYTS